MKKAMIFVPHQDDEVNLVGNILTLLVEEFDTYIIYSSLPADANMADVRKREAIKACSIYGIRDDHIMFLGYPDTSNKFGHHYFTDGNRTIVNDLFRLLNNYLPELIIGTDFDLHSDHRMLSLALDEAVKEVLYNNIDYEPRYLKGFCYETAYYGVDDYSASALGDTSIESERLGNISYRWDDRISIKTTEKNGFIFNKKAYKALKCHKSQYAVLHARSIINSDNVYWEKRTDNLLLRNNVRISASSGDVKKLNDFKVIDTNDIVTVDADKIDYSTGLWIPDETDEAPHIKISFDTNKYVNQIILYGNPCKKYKYDEHVTLYFDGSEVEIKQSFFRSNSVSFVVNRQECRELLIMFINRYDISEIEVFSSIITNKPKVESTQRLNRCAFIDALDGICFKLIVLIHKTKRKIIKQLQIK